MANTVDLPPRARRRRSDAQRSIDAIIAAACTVLGERPDASMEDVAVAASVSRQTVYAHFPSRDALIVAIIDSVRAEGLALIAEAHLDTAEPRYAIELFLDISWQLVHRFPLLLHQPDSRTLGSDSHGPEDAVTNFLVGLIRRGQRTGAFDCKLPATWLATATFSLGHTVAEEVAEGRLSVSKARGILKESVSRLYGSKPT